MFIFFLWFSLIQCCKTLFKKNLHLLAHITYFMKWLSCTQLKLPALLSWQQWLWYFGSWFKTSSRMTIQKQSNQQVVLLWRKCIEHFEVKYQRANWHVMIILCQIQPRRYFQKLPLQANFYPMPTMAYIQDSQYRLTLHTAQALGVTSLASGQYPGFLNVKFWTIFRIWCDKWFHIVSLSHPSQASWRWFWTVDWCRMITGV